MRRSVCALMISLALLSGCGNKPAAADEMALHIRTEYMAMTQCHAIVRILADYGERVYEYTLDAVWRKDGETVLTILEPEMIAGITARVQKGSSVLLYDGASLEIGELSLDGFSPIEAVPAAIEYMTRGYMAQCSLEQPEEGQMLLRILCRDPEQSPGTGAETEFWIDTNTHALVRAEFLYDGYVVLQCVFTEFTKE